MEMKHCLAKLDPDSYDDGDRWSRYQRMISKPHSSTAAGTSDHCTTYITPTPTLTVATATSTVPVQPPISNLGLLAFESSRDGNPEIYILNTNGFVMTRLTIDTATDTQPAWSPDGTRLAFVSNRNGNNDIYIVNADRTAVTNITNDLENDQHPSLQTANDCFQLQPERIKKSLLVLTAQKH
jgi:Tol biopolymer transport system component